MASTIDTISGLEEVRRAFNSFPETPEGQAELIRTAYPPNDTHPILRGRHAAPQQIYAVAQAIYERASALTRHASLDRFVETTRGQAIQGGIALVVGGETEPNYEGVIVRLAAGRSPSLVYWDSPLLESHLAIGFPWKWRVNRYLEDIEERHGIQIERKY